MGYMRVAKTRIMGTCTHPVRQQETPCVHHQYSHQYELSTIVLLLLLLCICLVVPETNHTAFYFQIAIFLTRKFSTPEDLCSAKIADCCCCCRFCTPPKTKPRRKKKQKKTTTATAILDQVELITNGITQKILGFSYAQRYDIHPSQQASCARLQAQIREQSGRRASPLHVARFLPPRACSMHTPAFTKKKSQETALSSLLTDGKLPYHSGREYKKLFGIHVDVETLLIFPPRVVHFFSSFETDAK